MSRIRFFLGLHAANGLVCRVTWSFKLKLTQGAEMSWAGPDHKAEAQQLVCVLHKEKSELNKIYYINIRFR